jgi:superfamily II DNA helicase RecQ
MALTASATPSLVNSHLAFEFTVHYLHRVQDDIVTNLDLSSEHLFKVVHPFNRPNLFYEVSHLVERIAPGPNPVQVRYISQQDTLALEISEYIKKLHEKRGMPSTGIIYCRTRQTCDELANFLRGKGLGARPYHKGLP